MNLSAKPHCSQSALRAMTCPQYPFSVPIEYQHASGDDCYRCGYDLRGIANDCACPECGLLAERSRRVSDELHNSRPRWLRKLSRGVWLILLSLVLLVAFSIVTDRLRNWLFDWNLILPSSPNFDLIMDLFPLFGPGIAVGVFLLGILMLTARERYGPADRGDRLRRVLLRLLAAVPLLGVITAGALIQWSLSHPIVNYVNYDVLAWRSFVLSLVVLMASIPLPALLFYQLRSLAKRARSAHLAEHCAIVGIGMSSAVLYGVAVFTVFQFAQQWGLEANWETRSSVSLVLMIIGTLSASLFVLWSVYLLIRFAIAFHSAARQLRQKWKRDDRATAS